MSAEQMLTLFGALSLAILTPGPAIIATVQAAFQRGRAHAMPYAMGLAFGASLWCLMALAGLAVVFRLNPLLFVSLKVFGGFYLLWFAWALWRASTDELPAPAGGVRRGFLGGIALNLSNPKPALFYATLILSVFPNPLGHVQQAAVFGLCLATEVFWYGLVAIGMSTAAMRLRYFSARFWIDRAAAAAMAALGLILILNH